SLGVGGSEVKIVRLANALAERGQAVTIGYLSPPTRLLGSISPRVAVVHLGRRGKLSLGALRQLIRTLRERNIRTLVSVNLYPALYARLARARVGSARVRFLAWLNTSLIPTGKLAAQLPLYRAALRNAEVLIFGAQAQRRLWEERYGIGTSGRAATVLYNGVDTDHFALADRARRSATGRSEPAFVLGTVGQMRPEKAQVDLLKATAELRSRGLNVDALIVGDGPERPRIEAEIERLGLRGHVELAGESTDVRPFLARMDVFVLTSVAIETFSNAALEAMASGLPVITSTVGGLRELVAFGGGLTYPPSDVSSLTDLAEWLVRDKAQRARLGAEARSAALGHFSWERMVDEFLAIAAPSGRRTTYVGGIEVSAFGSMAECARGILADARGGRGGFGVAINAEKVIICMYDSAVRATIGRATLRYPDGAGVVVAMRMKGARTARVAGADLWLETLREARGRTLRVALIGAAPPILHETQRRLRREFPEVHIVLARDGYESIGDVEQLCHDVAAESPELILVALGSPKQEILIENLRRTHPAGFYLGLGGSFDIYAGAKRRAPLWMQRCGTEWLFRFLSEPSRARRERKRLQFLAMLVSRRL
ncbi:MAG TPA: WecB/TagA/CpsF family glycosyltransferase, partial [Steroidobacteraceae bacterium]